MVTSRLHRAGANFLALQPPPTPCIHQNKKKKEAPIIKLATALYRPKTIGSSRAALCQSRGGFYQCLWAFPLSGSYDLSGAGNSDDSFLLSIFSKVGQEEVSSQWKQSPAGLLAVLGLPEIYTWGTHLTKCGTQSWWSGEAQGIRTAPTALFCSA